MAKAMFNAEAPEWWKHLREYKRFFWKRVRQGGKAQDNKDQEKFSSHWKSRKTIRFPDKDPF